MFLDPAYQRNPQWSAALQGALLFIAAFREWFSPAPVCRTARLQR
ncbi:hypothetical protein LNP74_21810 [Klebsiella pneumoniae subsp. pneumoniae]|nr:hypothetical protein [Klebsiella pneumoniae subsp. pneumoniae]